MRKIFYSLSIISFLALSIQSCGSSDAPKDEWYAGGTLHNSSMRSWKYSNEKNKLATCADYVANVKDYKGDLIEMKEDATLLMKCIDGYQNDKEFAQEKITDVASVCLMDMDLK